MRPVGHCKSDACRKAFRALAASNENVLGALAEVIRTVVEGLRDPQSLDTIATDELG
jgi:hypothetical protein